MKKLLITAIILGSVSSQAKALTLNISNVTYPNFNMNIDCDDNECTRMQVSLLKDNVVVAQNEVLKSELQAIADKRVSRDVNDSEGTYMPYELTQNASNGIKTQWNEGRHGRAIGKSLLAGTTAVVDTLALPASLINYFIFSNNYSKEKRRATKACLKTLEEGKDQALNHKKFLILANGFSLND